MITQKDIHSLINAANCAGFEIAREYIQLLTWSAGLESHIPVHLPKGYAAVYIFKYNDQYLKIGKASQNSNARYQSQHYHPKSCNSNLSKSLLNDVEMKDIVSRDDPGTWLRENTTRFNLLIPDTIDKNFVHFAEAFFILKCNPKFEKTRA